MTAARVMVTIPRHVLDDFDQAAERLATRRSSLLTHVLEHWLEAQRQAEETRLLEEGYQALASVHREIVDDFGGAQSATWIASTEWPDDE